MIEAERPFTNTSYLLYLNENKLMGSKCRKCGAIYHPPRPICPKCHASDMEWVQMKGKGRLIAFTCIAYGQPHMIAEGYGSDNPYCSGVVEMEEGVKATGRILGVDAKNPESIKIGAPLTVEYLPRGEGENIKTYLAFRV